MKISILFIWIFLSLVGCNVEPEDDMMEESIMFTWDNDPFDDGVGSVTETVGGITVTVTSPLSTHKHSVGFMDILDQDGNSKDNVVISYHSETSITFTFSQPVHVISVMAMSGENQNITYTFLALEEGNAPFAKNLIPGKNVAAAMVEFDWMLITSFTVSSSSTLFGFDYLMISTPEISSSF